MFYLRGCEPVEQLVLQLLQFDLWVDGRARMKDEGGGRGGEERGAIDGGEGRGGLKRGKTERGLTKEGEGKRLMRWVREEMGKSSGGK